MPRRTTVVFVTVCVMAALAAGIYLSRKTPVPAGPPAGSSTPPASSSPNPPAAPKIKATDPYQLVALYFTSLQKGDFAGAYAYLGPDLQKTLSYQAYAAGFQGSRVTAYDSSSLRIVGAGNISLFLRVTYTVSGPAGTATRTATLGCLNIAPGPGKPDWRIESIGQ